MPRDRTVCLLLVVVSILIRVPFLDAFDLVAFDGTFYINQAKSMLGASPANAAFPIGYPLWIALLLPIVRDGVRAAQIVSFMAGIGSVWILYALGKRIVPRPSAFVAALLLALTPLFIRFSLTTLSESTYIFWVLLGLYLYARGGGFSFGVSLGMAAITRPEGLGVFAVLLLVRGRPWRRLVMALMGFLALYSVNSVVLSLTLDRMVLGDTRFAVVHKTGGVGRTAATWQGREVWADFPGRESYEKTLEAKESGNVLIEGAKRFPKEFALLARHVMPLALILALYGVYRKRLFILAGLVAFVLYPFFTTRSEPRYVLPYVPFVYLYAAVGLDRVKKGRGRFLAVVLLIVSTAMGLVVNKNQLIEPVSDGFQWAKKAGLAWRGRIRRGDKVADRKPFFAFYAEAKYVEIPIAPYEEAIEYLAGENVRFVMLHRSTIETLRPALMPLLYDRALIQGELRLRQAEVDPEVYVLYERANATDPLERKRITDPGDGVLVAPSWSPDGKLIAYRRLDRPGQGAVFVVSPEGGQAQALISEPGTNDPLTWAPDSERIAFANSYSGTMDIHVFDILRGRIDHIIAGGASDRSPNWSKDGKEIVFFSDRSGQEEIWCKNLESGELTRLTSDGGNRSPALSPRGDRVAWVGKGQRLVILVRTTGERHTADLPRKVSFTPAWSPDGRFIAVTAEDRGGACVYLLTSDGGETLLLTKSTAGAGMPSWSPDGRRMVVVINEEGDYGLWILSGLEPYMDRLLSPAAVETFAPRE